MSCHPGFCKICGAPTHAIERQHPAGHPLAGRPLRIGKVLSDVVKAHLLMTNGTWATLGVHRQCVDLITPETLPQIWSIILKATKFEEDNRALLGAKPLNAKQKAATDQFVIGLASEVPLGVCCIEEFAS